MKIVVTGANGYIGSFLCNLATNHGHDVIMASRYKPSFSSSWMSFDLSSNNTTELPLGTDTVIHLAAKTNYTNLRENDREVIAAKKLIKSANKINARFIFVSSQTARADAPTSYGRTKWRIEQEVLSAGGVAVRPGLVYGGELCGLFGMLVKAIQRFPLLPAFLFPVPKVQPIHIKDLADGLLRIAMQADIIPGVYCLATTEPVSFSIFLKEIAKSRLRCWRGFVPIPVFFITGLSFALGKSLQTKLGLERLSSLFNLPVMSTESDLKKFGLLLRPLHSGMHISGNDQRRCLLREGRTLLTYILKATPSSAVLRHYVRVTERMRDGRTIDLPNFFLIYPIFLSLLDEYSWSDETVGAEFSWRLETATMLAEATPFGAHRFLGLGRDEHQALSSLLLIINAVACEAFWRILRYCLTPLIRLVLGRAKCKV